jgi:Uma2 family endonuclease
MSTLAQGLPPLVEGQRLTREEFLRRYEAMPHVKKAELIGGIVHMPSPVSRAHGTRDICLSTWMRVYAAYTPGCEAATNSTWLMLKDAPQPDSDLRILSECGGSSHTEGRYVAGAPELLTEVSQRGTAIDLTKKKKLYREAGVREYIVFLLAERKLLWYRLVGRTYKLMASPADGILRSQVFPGLWLDVPALLTGDMARVLQVLRQGLDSSEHASFVQELARRRKRNEDSDA